MNLSDTAISLSGLSWAHRSVLPGTVSCPYGPPLLQFKAYCNICMRGQQTRKSRKAMARAYLICCLLWQPVLGTRSSEGTRVGRLSSLQAIVTSFQSLIHIKISKQLIEKVVDPRDQESGVVPQ